MKQGPSQLIKIDAMKMTMTSSHALNGPAQSREPLTVDCELTGCQTTHESTQILEPDAVGRSALTAMATISASRSKVVVIFYLLLLSLTVSHYKMHVMDGRATLYCMDVRALIYFISNP